MDKKVTSESEMKEFGASIGEVLRGGEVIELVGDVGAGKTTFVKGLAAGMGIDDNVQSPSFTITQVYDAPSGLQLHHYDFYRLADPGIMKNELEESVGDKKSVTIVEWADTVKHILPDQALRITISAPTETTRELVLSGNKEILELL